MFYIKSAIDYTHLLDEYPNQVLDYHPDVEIQPR